MINPSVLDGIAEAAGATQPLRLGSRLISVETGHPVATEELVSRIAMAVQLRRQLLLGAVNGQAWLRWKTNSGTAERPG